MTRVLAVGLCLSLLSLSATAAEPPGVGDAAVDFELTSVGGKTLKLSEVIQEGPVVLLVMRGFPGYQCPLCKRQASAYAKEAKAFRDAAATVIMVYPGEVEDLNVKALQFLGDEKLPEGFHMVLDPGYKFTNSWNLRWDAPRETSYPSTFVIGKDQQITFAKISKIHGDRTSPNDVLKVLKQEL